MFLFLLSTIFNIYHLDSYSINRVPLPAQPSSLHIISLPVNNYHHLASCQVQQRNRQFRVLLQQIRDLKEDMQDDKNDANIIDDENNGDQQTVEVMDVVDEDDS